MNGLDPHFKSHRISTPQSAPLFEQDYSKGRETETSKAAYARVKGHKTVQYEQIKSYLRRFPQGRTNNEIVDGTGMKIQSVSGRCSELVSDGILVLTGERRDGGAVKALKNPHANVLAGVQ